jgi:HEAT repeat protein
MGVALALQTIGPDAMPAVLEALEAENKLLRLTALTVLAGVRSTKAIPPMLHSNAAQHEHGRIFPSLINLLKRGSAEERALAADALGRFAPHPPSATDQLRDALKDHRGTVRASAAKALGRIGPAAEEAVPDLVRILEPPLWDRAIRLISGEYAEELAGAAEALGRIGRQAEAAFPVLLRLLKHADDTVKLAAAEALADLDSGRAAPILVDLVKQPESRFVRYAFRRAGKEVVSALITALDDPDPEIQERVLSAMIRLDTAPEAAAPRLLELLESKHYWVRALAGGLLWRLRPEMRKQLEETVLADRRHCYFGDDLSFETHREPRRVLHELAGFIRTTLSSLAEATPQRDPLVSFFISQFADIIREPGEKDNAFHLQNLPLRRSPGLLALRGRTKQLISLLLANSRDIEVAQDTPLIALLVRGWQAEFWRSNGNIEGFEKKIAAAIDQQYIPVPEYFQYFEPATVTVRRKQPRHRGEILAPSQTALNDIADALTAAQMRPPYDKVRESALALLQEMLQAHERGTQLRQAMVGPDRIGSGLRSLRDKIEGAANSTELLGVLLSHDLNKKVLRQFYRGIRAMSIAELCDDIWASKRIRTFLREDLAPEDKIGAALALFADRIEGGLRRHAILKPLNSEKASLRLRQAFGIRGLNEELRRLLKAQSEQSGEAASGQITLKFKPDRGVLAELSGYICDTCWIRQEAIMRRHPNLVFVPFILEDPPRLEGGVASPFLGGAMVMFTRNAANEPVLVIRGLNPHDDLLRHASVQSVCESFIDYLAGVARSLKVTEILIPDDDNSGLTQSNRPQVNGYIKNTYRGHPARYPVTTLPSERKAETLFNDLELGPCIVLLRL